jgi:hypothetical protein
MAEVLRRAFTHVNTPCPPAPCIPDKCHRTLDARPVPEAACVVFGERSPALLPPVCRARVAARQQARRPARWAADKAQDAQTAVRVGPSYDGSPSGGNGVFIPFMPSVTVTRQSSPVTRHPSVVTRQSSLVTRHPVLGTGTRHRYSAPALGTAPGVGILMIDGYALAATHQDSPPRDGEARFLPR